MEIRIGGPTGTRVILSYVIGVQLEKIVIQQTQHLIVTGYKPGEQVMKAQWKKGYGLFPDDMIQYFGAKNYNIHLHDTVQVTSDKTVNCVTVKSEGDLYYLKNVIELAMGFQEEPKNIDLKRIGYEEDESCDI